jgi:hypothetical protein
MFLLFLTLLLIHELNKSIMQVKISFKSFSAHNARPGKYPNWILEDPEDRCPVSKYVYSFPV